MNIPIFYELSHYALGILSIKYKQIIIIFYIYQILQLCFNTRFFILNLDLKTFSIKNCFKKGNNINHTKNKLKQFLIGNIFGIILDYTSWATCRFIDQDEDLHAV